MSQNTLPQLFIEDDAVLKFIQYCRDRQFDRFMLIADANTYAALGQRIEQALQTQGWDVRTVVFRGQDEVIADEAHLIEVLVQADAQARVYLAVGSGTITDITRFVSHRTRNPFISLPTAPSVDGFVSVGAPLVIAGLKETIVCSPPIAAFADLGTLAAAPQPMIAAGFGDMLGKFTSLADWKLGHLLWDEPYDEHVAWHTWNALQACVAVVQDLGRATPASIRALIAGLLESGLSMIEFGSTVPASGSEHHLSHHWEMKLLWARRPALLHGAKVGVASILIAGYYDQIRQLTRRQVIDRLEAATFDRAQAIAAIRAIYPAIADRLVTAQRSFLDMSHQTFDQLRQRIIDRWSDVQDIAASVPAPQVMLDLLRATGGPLDPQRLGLSAAEVDEALRHAHYLRNRFTILKLSHMLGWL